MEKKHTAEPWDEGCGTKIVGELSYKYRELSEVDWERSKVCVNALAGIEDVEGFMEKVETALTRIGRMAGSTASELENDMSNVANEALALFPTPAEEKGSNQSNK